MEFSKGADLVQLRHNVVCGIRVNRDAFHALLERVRACRHCADVLPLGPRPVLRASLSARILIVGQAPGTRVHETGLPWNDPSGDRLRAWMGLDRETFYDESCIAIVPMGLCYPGCGKSGDLPPRTECRVLWFDDLLGAMGRIEFTILCGAYAQAYHLGNRARATLTETVAAWRDHWPRYLPTPHPSPRNIGWFRANPWFEADVVPALRERVADLLGSEDAR
ncbi:MAG: uracil-DNA glycosylase family protein [Deltaproteobacteria bacterium]|nr:uracil-DNA glycosylase family protein [Deltaproteobacteria bacterium]